MPVRNSAPIGTQTIPLSFSPEVLHALRFKTPIVAQESTIITHGMEYPTNVNTALDVEAVVRAQGATPATIAIMDGHIKVGLTVEEITELAKNKSQCLKCSRRDIATALVKRSYGSTTVAATMMIADWAGIKIFVTGGIGGVHRGYESSFDVSADLTELAKTPICVISSGAKSILDIPKTLEVLRSYGVNVCGYKQEDFPAFFIGKSGYKANQKLSSAQEAAQLVYDQYYNLGLPQGIIIGNPVPKNQEADGNLIESAIVEALEMAENQMITGALVTPFLQKTVNELTKGKSSDSNIAQIKHNAYVGAQIAKELSNIVLEKQKGVTPKKDASAIFQNDGIKSSSKKNYRRDLDNEFDNVGVGAEIKIYHDKELDLSEGEDSERSLEVNTRNAYYNVHKLNNLRPNKTPDQALNDFNKDFLVQKGAKPNFANHDEKEIKNMSRYAD